MSQLYVLYEHATGYAIFRTTEFEEVAVFLPQVRESILNISRFRSNVYFVTYLSFKERKEALYNMQMLTKGELSKDLQFFLENNVPRTKKSKQGVVLGVVDPDLALIISEKLGIKCISSGLVMEIVRGIRFHFYKLIKGFRSEDSGMKGQLSLAHQYYREKLKFDVTRQDSMIIESDNLMEQFQKDIQTLGKRIKGFYAFHFPELFKVMLNNMELFIRCVDVIGDRKKMPEDIAEKLEDVLNDTSKVETILYAAHNSMGSDISTVDLENLKMLCKRVISLMDKQQSTAAYLRSKMNHTAPNISSLVGEEVASKLIVRAGGLEKLAKLPASTVQVLGAEKKFFRNLKNKKGKTAISGLLSSTALLRKANKRKKSCIARKLANKCSLAARVDFFSEPEMLDENSRKFRCHLLDVMKMDKEN